MNTAGVGIYIEIVAEARTQKFLNGEKKLFYFGRIMLHICAWGKNVNAPTILLGKKVDIFN